jgi:two-component system, OmpR family, sensor histidine kinase KdpD
VCLDQAVASLVASANERERLEREAVEAETLRRTDAVKTAVIQSVSHDLRTPLATIETALDGLQSPTIRLDDAQQAELLESVRHELQRLERYVETSSICHACKQEQRHRPRRSGPPMRWPSKRSTS